MGTVATFRNYRIVEQLAKRAEEVHVFTQSYPASQIRGDWPTDFVDSTTTLPNFDYRFILNRLSANYEQTLEQVNVLKNDGPPSFLVRLLNSFPFNILIGEGGLFYIWKGYKKGVQLVRDRQITHLYSSFRPWSDHLIAFLLKQKFPHLHWVADFADLHIVPGFPNLLFPSLQRRINQTLIRRADLVTTVSHGLIEQLRPFHAKIHLIRNSLPIPVTSFAPPTPHPSPTFDLVYTGSLYGKRSGVLLFKVLHELIEKKIINEEKVKLIYAGKDGATFQHQMAPFGLTHLICNRGLLSPAEAWELQRTSQINLLFTWSDPRFKGWLTSKLYDYLFAQRPILALVNGPFDEEFEGMVGQIAPSYCAFETDTGLADWLTSQYRQWEQTGWLEASIDPTVLEAFTWQRGVQTLDATFLADVPF